MRGAFLRESKNRFTKLSLRGRPTALYQRHVTVVLPKKEISHQSPHQLASSRARSLSLSLSPSLLSVLMKSVFPRQFRASAGGSSSLSCALAGALVARWGAVFTEDGHRHSQHDEASHCAIHAPPPRRKNQRQWPIRRWCKGFESGLGTDGDAHDGGRWRFPHRR